MKQKDFNDLLSLVKKLSMIGKINDWHFNLKGKMGVYNVMLLAFSTYLLIHVYFFDDDDNLVRHLVELDLTPKLIRF